MTKIIDGHEFDMELVFDDDSEVKTVSSLISCVTCDPNLESVQTFGPQPIGDSRKVQDEVEMYVKLHSLERPGLA